MLSKHKSHFVCRCSLNSEKKKEITANSKDSIKSNYGAFKNYDLLVALKQILQPIKHSFTLIQLYSPHVHFLLGAIL